MVIPANSKPFELIHIECDVCSIIITGRSKTASSIISNGFLVAVKSVLIKCPKPIFHSTLGFWFAAFLIAEIQFSALNSYSFKNKNGCCRAYFHWVHMKIIKPVKTTFPSKSIFVAFISTAISASKLEPTKSILFPSIKSASAKFLYHLL